jgi:hypothetical protein
MQQRKTFVLLLGLAALAGLVAACRPIQPREEGAGAAPPKIELAKPQDDAELKFEDGRMLIDIRSDGGIGGASITWAAAPAVPPVLRLHLRGLEELRLIGGNLETGGVETIVSVASTAPHTVRQSTRSDGEAELQPIVEGDPAWLDVSWSPGGEAAGFPLQDGYFDVTLADTRLTQAGTQLELRWIDFYR